MEKNITQGNSKPIEIVNSEYPKYIVVYEYGHKTDYKILTKKQLETDFGVFEFAREKDTVHGEFGFKSYEDTKERYIDIYEVSIESCFKIFIKELSELKGTELH